MRAGIKVIMGIVVACRRYTKGMQGEEDKPRVVACTICTSKHRRAERHELIDQSRPYPGNPNPISTPHPGHGERGPYYSYRVAGAIPSGT